MTARTPTLWLCGGFAILTRDEEAYGLAILVTGSVVMSAGVASVGPLGTGLIVGAAPPERAGAASGISETGTEFGSKKSRLPATGACGSLD